MKTLPYLRIIVLIVALLFVPDTGLCKGKFWYWHNDSGSVIFRMYRLDDDMFEVRVYTATRMDTMSRYGLINTHLKPFIIKCIDEVYPPRGSHSFKAVWTNRDLPVGTTFEFLLRIVKKTIEPV